MERFTIGRCRSGKTITSHTKFDGLTSFDEVFDAMAVLSVLALSEIRQDRSSELAIYLSTEAYRLEEHLRRSGQWQLQMDAIGAKTSFDIRNYATQLLRPEFKEWSR